MVDDRAELRRCEPGARSGCGTRSRISRAAIATPVQMMWNALTRRRKPSISRGRGSAPPKSSPTSPATHAVSSASSIAISSGSSGRRSSRARGHGSGREQHIRCPVLPRRTQRFAQQSRRVCSCSCSCSCSNLDFVLGAPSLARYSSRDSAPRRRAQARRRASPRSRRPSSRPLPAAHSPPARSSADNSSRPHPETAACSATLRSAALRSAARQNPPATSPRAGPSLSCSTSARQAGEKLGTLPPLEHRVGGSASRRAITRGWR